MFPSEYFSQRKTSESWLLRNSKVSLKLPALVNSKRSWPNPLLGSLSSMPLKDIYLPALKIWKVLGSINMIFLPMFSDLINRDNPFVSLIFTVTVNRVSNVLYALECWYNNAHGLHFAEASIQGFEESRWFTARAILMWPKDFEIDTQYAKIDLGLEASWTESLSRAPKSPWSTTRTSLMWPNPQTDT